MFKRILICTIAILLTGGFAAFAASPDRQIQLREAQLRESPSYLSRIMTVIPYGQTVTILKEQSGWAEVITEDQSFTGWLHQSALTKRKLQLAAADRNAELSVSSEEQALAGKGFNSQVESEFKERNGSAAFAIVDEMERLKVPYDQIIAFLNEGGLLTQEGVQ